MKELSPRQINFVAAYVRTSNATQAARESGYSPRTARLAAQRLLANAQVRAAVDAERDRIREAGSYGIDAAVAEIDQNLAMAIAAKQFSAAASFQKLKLQVRGLLIERMHHQVELPSVTTALAEAQDRARRALDGGRLVALPAAEPLEQKQRPVDIFTD